MIFWHRKKNINISYTVWYSAILDLPGKTIIDAKIFLIDISKDRNVSEVRDICENELNDRYKESDWKVEVSFITYVEN